MQSGKTATIYVPAADAEACVAQIDAGSGIVGVALPGGQVLLHYEGNRYGAENLQRYDDRVHQAAGRLFQNYPTMARMQLPADVASRSLVAVGTIRQKTEAERAERDLTRDMSRIARLSAGERQDLAQRWDAIQAPYVIEFSNEDLARSYGER